MAECYIGEIRMFGGNYAPYGWALCNGQLLSISQNTALFSLLGTYYGGNGTSNFALPNLQCLVPLGFGQAPGLSPYSLGETGGEEAVTLNYNQMPAHNHAALAENAPGNNPSPAGNYWAESSRRDAAYSATANTTMNPNAISMSGGNQPHSNVQPFLVVNFIIALQGTYPPRG